ncbi:ATP-binding protein [Methylomonas methanica]
MGVIITRNPVHSEWGNVFFDSKATETSLDRLSQLCHIIETGNMR